MKEELKKLKMWHVIVLTTIIITALLRCLYIFSEKKEGFHSDEIWTYAFANSSDGAYIYHNLGNDGVPLNVKNFNSWIDGSVFFDFITVDEAERFSVRNVIENTKFDLSPPLYEILLHLVSSFFPGKFSWWFGLGINVACGAGILILLFLFSYLFTKKPEVGLTITGFYAYSATFCSTIIFIRMYALLTLLAVALIFVNYILYVKEYNKAVKEYIFLAVITIAGALTHYLFLPYAFLVTFVMCFVLLFKKKIKPMFIYGLTMLFAVGISWIIYPYAVRMMFGTRDTMGQVVESSFDENFSMALGTIVSDTFGIPLYIDRIFFLYFIFVLFWVIVTPLFVIFLFRNEKWMAPILSKYKHFIGVYKEDKKKFFKDLYSKINWFLLMLFVMILGCIVFICKFCNVGGMRYRTDRYEFLFAPMLVFVVLYSVFALFNLILKKWKRLPEILGLVVSVGLMIYSLIQWRGLCPFLYNQGEFKVDIVELTEDSNVILIFDDVFRLQSFCADMRECNQFFASSAKEYPMLLDWISDCNNDKNTYLFIQRRCFLDESKKEGNGEDAVYHLTLDDYLTMDYLCTYDTITEFMDNLVDKQEWVEDYNFVGTITTFNGAVSIYEINP